MLVGSRLFKYKLNTLGMTLKCYVCRESKWHKPHILETIKIFSPNNNNKDKDKDNCELFQLLPVGKQLRKT